MSFLSVSSVGSCGNGLPGEERGEEGGTVKQPSRTSHKHHRHRHMQTLTPPRPASHPTSFLSSSSCMDDAMEGGPEGLECWEVDCGGGLISLALFMCAVPSDATASAVGMLLGKNCVTWDEGKAGAGDISRGESPPSLLRSSKPL